MSDIHQVLTTAMQEEACNASCDPFCFCDREPTSFPISVLAKRLHSRNESEATLRISWLKLFKHNGLPCRAACTVDYSSFRFVWQLQTQEEL